MCQLGMAQETNYLKEFIKICRDWSIVNSRINVYTGCINTVKEVIKPCALDFASLHLNT
jgi:hypothetical protein